jgi:aerobic carbon-monoxide dehydrogenase small subunit
MNNIEFTLNGEKVSVPFEPTRRLLDVLRNDFNLIGIKEGCGEGECGACSVLIDHHVVNSCILPLGNVAGHTIMTIEGFKKTRHFAIIEQAFIDCGAVQCGFCTPGMVMATESLLHLNPHPTDLEIRIALSGNLCRCTGYLMIIEAVKTASIKGEGLW